jgi:hypothetical protein
MGDIFFQLFLAFLGIVLGIISQLVQPRAQRQILLICSLLLFLFAGLWWGFSLGATEPPSTETPLTEPAVVSVTDTPTFAPSDTPAAQPSDFTGYDFESGTQGWGTAEGEFKKAELSTTTEVVYAGNSALVLDMELFGSGSQEFTARDRDDVYRHTEAIVYLSNSAPLGYGQPGPYDLSGKTFTCLVYLPAGLAVEGAPRAYIRLIAKDQKFANQVSDAVDITPSNVSQWIELSFVIGNGSNADPSFDPTQTNALGVRIDSLDGSTVQYTGPIYVDNCSIK